MDFYSLRRGNGRNGNIPVDFYDDDDDDDDNKY